MTLSVRRFLRVTEAIAWIAGLALLANFAVTYVDRTTGSREALRTFEEARKAEALRPPSAVDQHLWSEQRIKAYQSGATLSGLAPLAVLRIPSIHLEVPILEGTDDETLNRGAGHIADTAAPGDDGNSGIAGHRDGFFRGLMDVVPGDTIELETRQGAETYRIERTWIVKPEDVSVLDPTPGRAITLVTCYPFYFIGPAPERFIVRAVRDDSSPAISRSSLSTRDGRRLEVVRSDGLLASPIVE